ncbi:hypothetical protein EU527_16240 [Candidatus Thorarchaeota archaeon]|nr:MAG: hypothetical protein EU527_16240 [Candidatus Thorarchaeota archaeon]
MRDEVKGVIAISTFIIVSLIAPVVELNRIAVSQSPVIVTGGWSDPIIIFIFGAYSSISRFVGRYGIEEGITNASSLPFLWLIVIYVLLLILLMIRKTSVKVAFPVSLMILISWVWLSFQIYGVLEDWIARPVLITPLLGSTLTFLFINDIDSLRKLLGIRV